MRMAPPKRRPSLDDWPKDDVFEGDWSADFVMKKEGSASEHEPGRSDRGRRTVLPEAPDDRDMASPRRAAPSSRYPRARRTSGEVPRPPQSSEPRLSGMPRPSSHTP